ncbi:alpha/beta hydrolase [Anaerosacchariphilus sp. NSJ-68]|uniref:Alpha/beta hydrolase n=2 Tax=Lachnospiraceae TaxID=186803 RepID=A0A923L9S8_9FIRM|nr:MULTISPECIES: alpha/beta hydrolase [Lachnospiraceae]MBC5658519.1 alpha/beta hydrolase [Anaerosacchariphilus hominis]MBC5698272.1 alpha/beta hydrolase [Roseburia difficilis]
MRQHFLKCLQPAVARISISGHSRICIFSESVKGQEASYENLYSAFVKYCNEIDGQIHLCGLSLGGILTLNYTLDFPQKVKTLVLIGTPYKVPKLAFSFQNIIFRFLPKSIFETMAFDKKNTFALGNTMKNLDFSNRVKSIECPTLVLCGKKDSANIKSAHFLAQNIKSAELEIIEDTGHVVNEENPEVLAQILTEFYSKNDF